MRTVKSQGSLCIRADVTVIAFHTISRKFFMQTAKGPMSGRILDALFAYVLNLLFT